MEFVWDHIQEHETCSVAKRNIVRAVGLKEMYRKNRTLEVCDPEYVIQYPHFNKKSVRFVRSCGLLHKARAERQNLLLLSSL